MLLVSRSGLVEKDAIEVSHYARMVFIVLFFLDVKFQVRFLRNKVFTKLEYPILIVC